MPITRTAMVDDDGSGTTGTILNNAWKQELYNQIDALVPYAWTAYTPAWSASGAQPAVGNGQIVGRYALIGRTVHFVILLTMGSTTTFGGGIYTFSLPPVAVQVSVGQQALTFAMGILNGGGSASPPALTSGWNATSVYGISTSGGLVGPTIPITFNAGCSIRIVGTYEAA